MQNTSPRFNRVRLLTTLTLILGYMGYYLCRSNLSAAAPAVERGLGLNHAELGLIFTLAGWAYGLGKFTHGFAADLVGGRRLFLLGLVGAALGSGVFGLGQGLGFLTAVWVVNRFLQAGGWVGMVQVTAQWYPHRLAGTAMAFISLSYLLGDLAARWMTGIALDVWGGWRAAFFLPSGVVLVFSVLAFFTLKATPEAADLAPLPPEEAGPARVPGKTWSTVRGLLKDPVFLSLGLLSVVLTTLRHIFLVWSAVFFASLGADDGDAARASSVFAAAGVVATLVAGIGSDRLSAGRRGPVSFLMLLLLVLALVGLATPLGQGLTGAVVLVGVAGFGLYGPFSLLGGAGAIDVGGRQAAATAAGLLDGTGYLVSSLIAGVGFAAFSARFGWSMAWWALAGLAVFSLLPAWVLARQERPADRGAAR